MPTNRKTLSRVMEQLGWETIVAADGLEVPLHSRAADTAQALEQVQAFSPQLVCMDRHMPVSWLAWLAD